MTYVSFGGGGGLDKRILGVRILGFSILGVGLHLEPKVSGCVVSGTKSSD